MYDTFLRMRRSTRQSMYAKALEKWGTPFQLNQAKEEAAELIVALNKFQRGKADRESVLEEIADILIMIEQLKLVFGFSMSEIGYHMDGKLVRLAEILEVES